MQKPQAQNIPSQLVDASHRTPERLCDKSDPVLLSASTQESFSFGPAGRIRQTSNQIEPMLGVPEQVIGTIVGRKLDNGKGLACRRLIIKRKKYGVSDGCLFLHSALDGYQSHLAKKVLTGV